MLQILKLNIQELHLFETSLLGKDYILNLKDNTILVIPCYNPNYTDDHGKCFHSLKCYLLFDKLKFYNTNHCFYAENLIDFSGLVTNGFHKFNDKNVLCNCFDVVGLGYLECGIGELSYNIVFGDFFILHTEFIKGFNEPNVNQIIHERAVQDFLLNPDITELSEIIKNYFN
jgi:hypothetical protein